MKCLALSQPQKFEWIERDLPSMLQSGEALIKIHRVGICGTDFHAYRGKQPFFEYPRVLGHELGAEVIELNINDETQNPQQIKVGDRVSVEPYLNCGECQPCTLGKINCCENLKVLGVHTDGGFTEYIKVPIRKLHASEKLSYEQLAVVETLGIGAHAVQRGQVTAKDIVLVIGAGPIGLSVIQFAKIQGAKVVVIDINQERLSFASERLKADLTIHKTENFEIDTLKKHLDGVLPTVVFDATGHPQSMKESFELVSFGGRLVFVGLFIGEVSFYDPMFHRREMTVLASRNSLPSDFQNIIRLMESGAINTEDWITHKTSFEMLPATFESWLNPSTNVIKAMVSI